jgi:hypothetical protein
LCAGPGTLDIKDCSKICNNRLDFVCAAKNRCWGNVGRFFGLTLGLVSAAALLFLALKFGWLASLLPLLSCCCGGSSSSRARKSKQRKYEYDDDEYTSHDSDDNNKQKGRHKDGAGSAACHSSSAGRHAGQQYGPDIDELQAEQQRRQQSTAGRPRGASRSGRTSSKAEIYADGEQQEYYDEAAAGVARGSSYYGSAKKYDKNDGYNKYSSSGSGSPAGWIKSGPWDDSAAGGAGGRVAGSARASGVQKGKRSSSSGAGGRAPAGYFLEDDDGYEQGLEIQEQGAMSDEGERGLQASFTDKLQLSRADLVLFDATACCAQVHTLAMLQAAAALY